jgi:hypothetical protein
VAVLLLTGLPLAQAVAPAAGVVNTVAAAVGAVSTPVVAGSPSLVPGASAPNGSVARSASSATATVAVADVSDAKNLSWAFWGVNVAAAQQFTTTDASNIAATPVNFIRFPGGILGEEFNYTSGVLTNDVGGGTSIASTSIQEFIASCQSIGCHAILQLPAEIDQPQTAAYYASYVQNTLHFKPSYWEIGNAVQSWGHFDTPWSKWGTNSGKPIDSLAFAQELGKYITAIRAVVPGARIIALGMATGRPNNDQDYITEVASLDGPNISGISVHSYVNAAAPPKPTWADLLSNLNGEYSLASGITTTQSYIKSGCPKCHLSVFVTEANAAEVTGYSQFLPTFAGTLYVAADTIQALNLRVKNLDWFAYSSHYLGAWDQGGTFEQQYTLMTQMMTHLGTKTLATTVTGPSMFYGTATYGTAGLALLLVNANMTQSVSLNLASARILSGALVHEEQWKNGSDGPTNSSFNLGGSLTVPALSITILTVAPSGVQQGSPARGTSHEVRAPSSKRSAHPDQLPTAGALPDRAVPAPLPAAPNAPTTAERTNNVLFPNFADSARVMRAAE